MARALAFLIGVFALVNVLGGLLRPEFNANGWWIDLRTLPEGVASVLLLLCGVGLLAYALQASLPAWQQYAIGAALLVLLCGACWDAITFFRLQWTQAISARVPVPLSLLFALAFGFLLTTLFKPELRGEPLSLRFGAAAFATGLLLFPLAQMYFFGKTDYRRHADAIVVFGARTYADGSASQALTDRVQTACELYREGYAPTLIFSGGPGDGNVHETEAMRRLALNAGVRDADIVLDRNGLNTHATVANTRQLFQQLKIRRVLAVSHFYHLPRVKMAYQQSDLFVCTVPAREKYTLTKMPVLMAREVVAFWSYYLQPLWHSA